MGEMRFVPAGKAEEMIAELEKTPTKVKVPEFGEGITEEDKKVYRAFQAMKKGIDSLDANEKKGVLCKALNLVGHYEKLFANSETLTITPTKADNDWVLLPALGKISKLEVK